MLADVGRRFLWENPDQDFCSEITRIMVHQSPGAFVCKISYHDSTREIIPSHVSTECRKRAKFAIQKQVPLDVCSCRFNNRETYR